MVASTSHLRRTASREIDRSKEDAMGEIQSIARFKIHDGKLEEWKRLDAEAMESVRSKDSGTLQYDLFLSDDSSGVVYENFRDSDALLEHFAKLGERMNAA
jgi:quinol monooxygenase YgiN